MEITGTTVCQPTNLHRCWSHCLTGTLLGTLLTDLHPTILHYSAKVGKVKQSYSQIHTISDLDRPWGSRIDEHGNLYIVEHYGHQVTRFRPDKESLTSTRIFGHPFSLKDPTKHQLRPPIGLATLPNGNVVLTEYPGAVVLFSPEGKVLKVVEGFNNPYDIKVNHEGNVVVMDTRNQRLAIYTPDLDFIKQIQVSDAKGTPTGLCIGPTGDYVVLDNGSLSVSMWDPTGFKKQTVQFKPGSDRGKLLNPLHMDVDCDGKLIIGDFGNTRVQIFSPEGEFITSFGDGLSAVSVMLDCEGNIFVSDYEACQVVVWG